MGVCHHGTSAGGFDVFKPKVGFKSRRPKQQLDLGSHFSGDKDYASSYTKNKKTSKIYETFLRIEDPLYIDTAFYREDDEREFLRYINFATKILKLKLSGDYFYDKRGDKQEEPQFILINRFLIDKVSSYNVYHGLLQFGFDGVFHQPYNSEGLYNFKEHPKAYVVLQPNQVKSLENDGSWDINDDNIYS